MPHISDKKLDEKYFQQLYSQLVKVFDTTGTARKSEILLNEFLTDTEKIMFAKRLAIICLLCEGVSKPFISDILLISPSTVDRISLQYEIGYYAYLENLIKKNSKPMWEVLENMIHSSVSKRLGKRRLAWFTELERKHNTKIFKY